MGIDQQHYTASTCSAPAVAGVAAGEPSRRWECQHLTAPKVGSADHAGRSGWGQRKHTVGRERSGNDRGRVQGRAYTVVEADDAHKHRFRAPRTSRWVMRAGGKLSGLPVTLNFQPRHPQCVPVLRAPPSFLKKRSAGLRFHGARIDGS